MEQQGQSRKKPNAQVFVSHAHIDDELPPDTRSDKPAGFVTYLVRQLIYELRQLGLKDGLWLDRYKLKSEHNWKKQILDALERSDILLAIVSNNFIDSEHCQDEVNTFIEKLRTNPSGNQFIFRVDKMPVANDRLPVDLQDIQRIAFYAEDRESGSIDEFYRRGKPTKKKFLEIAIKKLADDIFRILDEHSSPPPPPPPPPLPSPTGLTIYLAKPASDLTDAYQTLVREFRERRHHVVPEPGSEIPDEGDAATAFVRSELAKADLSVHVVGDRRGNQPYGLAQGMGIVPLQLIEARAVAAHNPRFQRLIWAPRIVPGGPDDAPERDASLVLGQLDGSAASDELFDDTAARFKDFVLDRLRQLAPPAPPPPPLLGPSVYVAAARPDRQWVARAIPELKAFGAKTTGSLDTEFKGAAACDHVVVCWGDAEEADMLTALVAARRQLREAGKPNAKLCLLVYPPESDSKQIATELDSFGEADLIIDASQPLQRDKLAPLFGDGAG